MNKILKFFTIALILLSNQLNGQILLTTSHENDLRTNPDLSSNVLIRLPAHKDVELLDFIPDGKYGGYFKVSVYGLTGYIHRNSVYYDDAFYIAIEAKNGNVGKLYIDNKDQIDKLNKRKKYEEELWAKQNFKPTNSTVSQERTTTATSTSSNTANNTGSKEVKSYYKDGKAYQYYVHNGISVTMHLSIEKNYGKYYVAYISIENLTGKSFNFNPNNITAIYTKNGEYFTGEVLSSDEYMRKVNNRQAWNAALVAFGESYSASQAGYSSSSTTSTTSGYSNSYGSASGYYGNTYGSVYGSSSTNGTSTTRSSTQSYDGAANYAAQQNAQQNIANYQNQQYQIKSVLNEGYLKLNTLDNEQRMVGYVNVKYISADKVKITIPVNGVNYEFWWNNN